jgi:GNAT superfamily N-acetyltransferase
LQNSAELGRVFSFQLSEGDLGAVCAFPKTDGAPLGSAKVALGTDGFCKRLKMIDLVPIEKNMDVSNMEEGLAKSSVESTLNYYNSVGFTKPWVSYLACFQGKNVGICAFKGKPTGNSVEIAYCTFPPYEGQGLATKACERLIHIARGENANIAITARTLPEENASTKVLRKNGFVLAETVVDPDDGDVFEWILNAKDAGFR